MGTSILLAVNKFRLTGLRVYDPSGYNAIKCRFSRTKFHTPNWKRRTMSNTRVSVIIFLPINTLNIKKLLVTEGAKYSRSMKKCLQISLPWHLRQSHLCVQSLTKWAWRQLKHRRALNTTSLRSEGFILLNLWEFATSWWLSNLSITHTKHCGATLTKSLFLECEKGLALAGIMLPFWKFPSLFPTTITIKLCRSLFDIKQRISTTPCTGFRSSLRFFVSHQLHTKIWWLTLLLAFNKLQ